VSDRKEGRKERKEEGMKKRRRKEGRRKERRKEGRTDHILML
jgi:hypothetical protein